MKVLILSGEYRDMIGELIKEKDFGFWSSVHIKGIGIIFMDKTYLQKINEDDSDDKNNTN